MNGWSATRKRDVMTHNEPSMSISERHTRKLFFLYRQCKDISASFDSNSALFKWTKVYEWSSPGASNSSSNCEIKDAFIAASGSLSKCCWEWFLIAEARRMKTSVRNGTRCENKNTCLLTQCKVISLVTFVLKVLFVHYKLRCA